MSDIQRVVFYHHSPSLYISTWIGALENRIHQNRHLRRAFTTDFNNPTRSDIYDTMGILSWITGAIAPIFIIISPITSYADQTYSIHRTKSSAGFSMDIPLIMLVASLLRYVATPARTANGTDMIRRVFYYPGAKFDISLLIQSFIMIAIQIVLLKVALDHRPSPSSKGGEAHLPFVGAREGEFGVSRPYNFWQWRSPKP